jgi:SAM-dependent methyltransferase
MSDPRTIFDRELLRHRRQRAAPRMAAHAFLLERFRDDIAERLSLIQRSFNSALILGAQGGVMGELLRRRGVAQVVEMETTQTLFPKGAALCVLADEEAIPFADGSFDLVVAPLTLHFINDLPGTLLQIRRCLKPDGLFVGGLFGGTTLYELRAAWLEAEAETSGGVSPRVAPFADVRDLGGLLQRAGFALPVVDSDVFRVRYASAFSLMQDLRGMGAGNVMRDRRRVPVGRRLARRVGEIYAERFADTDGRIPATFELLVMTGWAPHQSQQKPMQPGTARTSLAGALGTVEHSLTDKANRK